MLGQHAGQRDQECAGSTGDRAKGRAPTRTPASSNSSASFSKVSAADNSFADRNTVAHEIERHAAHIAFDDLFRHLLGVAEQHHRVVAIEQRVVDAGIARRHAALDEHHGVGLPHFEHRHAVDRRRRIVLGGGIGHVIGADDEGDVGLREFGIDVLELEHFVIGHVGLGQQHVHMAGHAPRHRMDGIFDGDARLLQMIGHFAQRMLGLRHRHAIARHDDDRARILHDEGGIIGRALLDRPRFGPARRSRRLAAEAAEDDADEGAVHALAHDVGEDGARRADQRAGDDERRIGEREADAGRRPARIGIEHRDDDRHVGAADRHDEQEAERQADGDDQPEIDGALAREEADR